MTAAVELSAADHARRVAAGWELVALEDQAHADEVARALKPGAEAGR